jgi:hypothetical protein
MPSSAHPYYDPSNSKSTGHASNNNPGRDPLVPATDAAAKLRSAWGNKPVRDESLPDADATGDAAQGPPMPTAKQPSVPEYKPSYEEHADVAVYNPKEKNR